MKSPVSQTTENQILELCKKVCTEADYVLLHVSVNFELNLMPDDLTMFDLFSSLNDNGVTSCVYITPKYMVTLNTSIGDMGVLVKMTVKYSCGVAIVLMVTPDGDFFDRQIAVRVECVGKPEYTLLLGRDVLSNSYHAYATEFCSTIGMIEGLYPMYDMKESDFSDLVKSIPNVK